MSIPHESDDLRNVGENRLQRQALVPFASSFSENTWAKNNPDEQKNPQAFGNYLELWRQGNLPLRGRRSVLRLRVQSAVAARFPNLMELCAQLLETYYGINIEVDSTLEVGVLSADAWRGQQLRVPSLVSLFIPSVQPHNFSVAAIVESDLCPSDDTNFVFGECHAYDRWLVVSLARYEIEKLESGGGSLLRLFKVLAHEVGHAIGMPHCVLHLCLMNGVNNKTELDELPFDLCPECVSKASWAANYPLDVRYRRLSQFMSRNGFFDESLGLASKHKACARPNIQQLFRAERERLLAESRSSQT